MSELHLTPCKYWKLELINKVFGCNFKHGDHLAIMTKTYSIIHRETLLWFWQTSELSKTVEHHFLLYTTKHNTTFKRRTYYKSRMKSLCNTLRKRFGNLRFDLLVRQIIFVIVLISASMCRIKAISSQITHDLNETSWISKNFTTMWIKVKYLKDMQWGPKSQDTSVLHLFKM